MTDARLQVEATLTCPTCGGTPYRLFRRSTAEHPDIFTHVLWPTDPAVLPPMDISNIVCPNDGTPLKRVSA